MTDVFLERTFDPAISREDVLAMAANGSECFGLHRIGWHGSLLGADGRRMLCHFEAADAESVRIALRQLGAAIGSLWPGTVHRAAGTSAAGQDAGNVLVARRFEAPVTLEAVQSAEDRKAWCLEARGVSFLRSYFSSDRKRMMCVYRAPDAESVRLAEREAGVPFEDVWAVRPVR